jgi:putative ABC transport system permease protein
MKRLFRLSLGERGVRRDVSSEIGFHIEMRTRELIEAGVSPDLARAQAIDTFGDIDAIEAACRDEQRHRVQERAWRGELESIGQDLRYAVRTLVHSPGFTATVLLTLALGIGANSAIFSMVNGVLLRRLPYANADRIVVLQHPSASLGIEDLGFSAPEVADLGAQTASIDAIAEYHSMSFDLLGHGDPRRVQTGVVSADFFRLLGVKPMLGRAFLNGEDQEGAAPVLVLSYRFWLNELGADSSIVGKTFTMNDRQHVVVGVLPPLPNYPDQNDVFMPISSCPFRSQPHMKTARGMRMVSIVARAKPGVALTTVGRDMEAVESRSHTVYPDAYKGLADASINARPLRAAMTESARPAFLLLLAVAGLVLLIACANVTHLTLARHLRRQRELAIRTALGAGRGRLLRQLVTESLLLSITGAALGLVFARLGIGALASLAARFTSRASDIVLDWRVALFTLAVAVMTGLAFGMIPAFADSRDLVSRLRDGSATSSGGKLRLRSALVVGEVALAFVVLVSAGLTLRNLAKVLTTNPGYDPHNVLTAHVDLNWTKYKDGAASRQFANELVARLSAMSGIRAVAVASAFPASSSSPQNRNAFDVRGQMVADTLRRPKAEVGSVSPDYFRAIGAEIRSGRPFTEADRDTAASVAIVSQSAARKYFASGDAVGKQISFDGGMHWATVVGVVADVRQFGPTADVAEQVYLPYAIFTVRDLRLLVRTEFSAALATNLIRQTIHAIDPEQPVVDIRTLEQARQDVIASPRLTTVLLGLFAVLALAIAAAGLGGVMAYSVGQRTHEFGIRMALGADRSSILQLVLGQGVRLVLFGLVIGGIASRVVARVIDKQLYGVRSSDPLTYAGVAIVFVVVAALACLVPARRATAVDPVSAFKAS